MTDIAGPTAAQSGASSGLVAALGRVARRIGTGRPLPVTMQAIADAVVESLGFGVAAVNLRSADGTFEVVAVAGSTDAAAVLLGTRNHPGFFDEEFTRAERWGGLRFVPHDLIPPGHDSGWIPPHRTSGSSGAWHPLDALFAPLVSAAGELVGVLSVDQPIDGRLPSPTHRELLELFALHAGIAVDAARLTEALHAEQRALAAEHAQVLGSERAFRAVFEHAGTGMVLVALDPDSVGRIVMANHAACALLSRTHEQLEQTRLEDIIHPDDLPESTSTVAAALRDRRSYRADRRCLRGDGSTIWLSLTATPIALTDPPDVLLIQGEDITDRRDREAHLRHRADHDPLTGLPNRRLLRHRLAAVLSAPQPCGALLFCDLDGFKAVNDRHGHQVGDQALQEVAALLLSQVRGHDTVARLGGDEFVILADDLDPDGIPDLLDRIRSALARPLTATGQPLGVSIGALALPEHPAASPEELLTRADRAMYQNKSQRKTALRPDTGESASEGAPPGRFEGETGPARSHGSFPV